MSVRCLYCGKEYDVTLFEFGRSVNCICGKAVIFKHEQMTEEALLSHCSEERKVREITKMADRISSLIVGSDYPLIDIEIEKERLRERILELFPDKIGLYDLIYEPRFRRLTDQFREQ